MSSTFHPWVAEARLVLKRRLRASAPKIIALMLIIVGGFAISALALRAAGIDHIRALAFALQTFVLWPLSIGAAIAALAYAGTRNRLLAVAEQMNHGWWGAVPVDPRCVARTLVLLTLGWTVLSGLQVAAVIMFASVLADGGDTLAMALLVSLSGLAMGAIGGLVAALRYRGARRMPAGEGIRQPLVALSGWGDGRLPQLFVWQRRETTLRWRRGGSFWLLGLVMVALPGGISPVTAMVVLAVGVVIVWTSVALRASLEAFLQARWLLAACPLPAQRLRKAAWHYPALACASTLACAAVGAWRLGFSSTLWAAGAAALMLVSPALVSTFAALRKPSRLSL